MVKISREHTTTAGIALVALLLLTEGAGAVKEINSCTDITSPDTYVLNADIINSDASRCINITSSNVILDGAGHTIDGTGAEGTYGVYAYDPAGMGLTNVNVKNLKITDWDYGIYYSGYFETTNGSITDNFISSNHPGITLEYASNHILTNNIVVSGGIELIYSQNNKITNNNAGIFLHHSHGNTITGNNANSKGGILLHYAADNTVTHNDVSSNHYGVSTSYAASNVLANNKITESDTGIYLGPVTDDNTITDNNISSNGYGISSDYATNNTINNNIVSSNDYGISLTSSSNNIIYNNYFSNTNNAREDGTNIWNIRKTAGTNIIGGPWLGGNYWSDYTGEDTDGDGLGDTLIPYNSGGNITNGGDYLPLVRTSEFHGITGTVFNDVNQNEIRDAGEEGLANRIIQLKGADESTGRRTKRTATTDINGKYVFADLEPGFYMLSAVQEHGWISTTSPIRTVHLGEDENTIVDFGNKKIR